MRVSNLRLQESCSYLHRRCHNIFQSSRNCRETPLLIDRDSARASRTALPCVYCPLQLLLYAVPVRAKSRLLWSVEICLPRCQVMCSYDSVAPWVLGIGYSRSYNAKKLGINRTKKLRIFFSCVEKAKICWSKKFLSRSKRGSKFQKQSKLQWVQ